MNYKQVESTDTRIKSLDDGRVTWQVQSPKLVQGEDVQGQTKDINLAISQIAGIASATSISKPGAILDNISKYLGDELLLFFQTDPSCLGDKQVVQAIIQMFLSQSCMQLIDSWHIGNSNIDEFLHHLDSRIRMKGVYRSQILY